MKAFIFCDDSTAALQDGFANELSFELKRLAQKHGLNLITDNTRVQESEANLFVNFARGQEHRLPIAPAHLSLRMVEDPCRAFGIND